MPSTPAARVLLTAVAEIGSAIAARPESDLDVVTACDPWTVRDVVAHCSGSMLRLIEDRSHRFTPEDNQGDVDERHEWEFADVLAELSATAAPTAERINRAEGRLDGLGLGVWVHAGDVRQALGTPEPYSGPGVDLALGLLEARSRRADFSIDVQLGAQSLTFGRGESRGSLVTDPETFVRLTAGRGPEPKRYTLTGTDPADLVLFT